MLGKGGAGLMPRLTIELCHRSDGERDGEGGRRPHKRLSPEALRY
jgi:hypothetical protein